jgi:hypothetical protein
MQSLVNDDVCQAFGCCEKAVREIKVDAGKFGTITLLVCANCVEKFRDD